MKRIKFKSYSQNQLILLPPDISDLIPEKHLSRVVNTIVENLDIDNLTQPFELEGAPSYHPRMMMKILIYSYCTKLFSSRKIEKALKQDITYMWLSGMQFPDHNTINRFRSEYFKEILENVFTEVLDYMYQNGYVRFESYFVDGTKIEADANKNTYVWKANEERYKSQLKERVLQLFLEIQELNKAEDTKYGEKSLEELGQQSTITSENLKALTEKLNEEISQEPKKQTKRKLTSKIKKIETEREKLEKYEEQEKFLGQRNSYSKTDTDATFMRMKNDELRPAYNPQVSTENQIVTNYTVSQNTSDTAGFVEHVEKMESRGEKYIPHNFVGDAAYGSQENYTKLDELEIENYLKYNTFYIETTGKNKNPFHRDNMKYDPIKDCFECPNGKKLVFKQEKEQTSTHGFKSIVKIYEGENCEACPMKNECTKSQGNRTVQVNEKLEEFKKQARENLQSEKGIKLRKRRGVEIETFWGDLKFNQGYRRFRLRGLEKVVLELGWLCISYNLRKLHIIESKCIKKASN